MTWREGVCQRRCNIRVLFQQVKEAWWTNFTKIIKGFTRQNDEQHYIPSTGGLRGKILHKIHDPHGKASLGKSK